MRLRPLTNEEAAHTGGASHRLDFTYKDIPAGIANNTSYAFNTPALGMPAIPASCIVKRVQLHLTVPLENTADAAFNDTKISLGDNGSATRYLNAVQANVNGTEVIDTFPGATENNVYTSADQLILTLGSMTAKSISNINKGQFYILIWFDLPGTPRRTLQGAPV